MKTWILVANASEAHCYSYENKKHLDGSLMLESLAKYENPSNHKKEDDLVSGRSGSHRNGPIHGSFEPTDPKEIEADRFAKRITEIMDAIRMAHEYDNLVLVVPSHFQGLLNKHLKKEITPLIRMIIQKDYTQLPIKELETQLAEQLP